MPIRNADEVLLFHGDLGSGKGGEGRIRTKPCSPGEEVIFGVFCTLCLTRSVHDGGECDRCGGMYCSKHLWPLYVKVKPVKTNEVSKFSLIRAQVYERKSDGVESVYYAAWSQTL